MSLSVWKKSKSNTKLCGMEKPPITTHNSTASLTTMLSRVETIARHSGRVGHHWTIDDVLELLEARYGMTDSVTPLRAAL